MASTSQSRETDAGVEQETTPTINDRKAWPRIPWRSCVVVGVTIAFVAWLTIPRLPPGICFGDSGELQLASAVLGITHAPGYPGYLSLGYLATLVPGVEPAYLVSLAYLLAGLVVVYLCIMMQLRLGVHPLVACGMAIALATTESMWINLLAPEVYVPSLALAAGAAYLLMKYHRLGVRRDLYIAGFLFGVVLANRPPILFALPFFIWGWWIAGKGWDTSWQRAGKTFLVLVGWAVLPMFYSLGYLYVRDTPQSSYNYIENSNKESRVLPDVDQGWRAKVKRVIYHATAQEFTYAMGNSWSDVLKKLRWLRIEFFLGLQQFLLALSVVAVGAVVVYRQSSSTFWVLLGLAISSIVFVCAYNMFGQAADYLPLLWVGFIFGGVATSLVIPVDCKRVGRLVAASFLAVVGTMAVVDVDDWSQPNLGGNAIPYLTQLDLATLPHNSVVCVKWPVTPAIFYAKTLQTDRDDLTIVAGQPKNWLALVESMGDRPVFATDNSRRVKEQKLTPFRFSKSDRPEAESPSGAKKGHAILWSLERAEPRPGDGGDGGR